MKTKNLFATVLAVVFLITGCVDSSRFDVYDDDQKIASTSNSFNLTNVYQASEDGHFTASVEKMKGMDTLWSIDAEEGITLDITYTLNVSSGKAKLVLINPDGELSIIAECSSEMTEPAQSVLNLEKGKSRIKLVATDKAKFDIELSISEGKFEKLGFDRTNQ